MKKNYFLLLFIGIVQLFNAQCIVAPNISYSGVSASYPAGTAITPLIITNTGDPVVTVSNQMTTLVSNVTSPQGVAVDAAGNLYYLDYYSGLFKRTAGGIITSVNSSLTFGGAVCIDASGNLYVTKSYDNVVYKIATDNTMTTYASGFNFPSGITIDSSGNLYVCDFGNHAINKVDTTGAVTTFATGFSLPNSITIDGAGNLFMVDSGNNKFYKISATGVVTLLNSGLNNPSGVAVDPNGVIYIANSYDNAIIKRAVDGTISTVDSSLSGPSTLALDASGALFIADSGNNAIKKLVFGNQYSVVPSLPAGLTLNVLTGTISGNPTVSTGTTTYTISVSNNCGTSTTPISFSTPCNVPAITTQPVDIYACLGTASVTFSVAATGDGLTYQWQKNNVNITGANQTTLTLTNVTATDADNYECIITGNCGNLTTNTVSLFLTSAPAISYAPDSTYIVGTPITTLTPTSTGGAIATDNDVIHNIGSGFSVPYDAAPDAFGNVYVTESTQIKKVAPDGTTTVFATGFNGAKGIATDAAGNVYFADQYNNAIKKITPSGVVTSIGTGFNLPNNVALDASGNVYVMDYGNYAIKKIATNNTVSVINNTLTTLNTALALDNAGNIYFTSSTTIYKISTTGTLSTLYTGFSGLRDIVIDSNGYIYVTDNNNNLVKKFLNSFMSVREESYVCSSFGL